MENLKVLVAAFACYRSGAAIKESHQYKDFYLADESNNDPLDSQVLFVKTSVSSSKFALWLAVTC